MEYKGWVKLHRKLIDSAIFGNEKGLKVWLWCLLKASHKDHDLLIGRQKLLIHKGQFVMGSERAVNELKLAKATIWYWLNFLEKEGQVRLQKTTKYTVVTLLNWTEYQEDLDTNETPKERQVGTYKNVENGENEKKIPAFAEETIEISETEGKPKKERTNLKGWSEFIGTYPKQVNLAKASTEWRSMGEDERTQAFTDVKYRNDNQLWPEFQFILNPHAYLTGRRWEDKHTEPKKETIKSYGKPRS